MTNKQSKTNIFAEIATNDNDLNKAFDVRRQVFIDEQNVPCDEEFDEYDDLSKCTHILLKNNDLIIGTARIIKYKGDICKYQRVAISKEYRGLGFGIILVKKLDEVAKNEGFNSVEIDAQQYAEKFYEKLGFITTNSIPFLDAGIQHIKMKKAL